MLPLVAKMKAKQAARLLHEQTLPHHYLQQGNSMVVFMIDSPKGTCAVTYRTNGSRTDYHTSTVEQGRKTYARLLQEGYTTK